MNPEDSLKPISEIAKSKLANKVYDDILSKPGKKLGAALSTVIDFGNTVLWPVKYANGITELYFKKSLSELKDRIDAIEDEKIVPVPSEIAIPILEKFTYVSNEMVRKAYLNLMVKASSIDTCHTAHPAFLQVIERMSPDEAVVLNHIPKNKGIPVFSIKEYVHPIKKDDFRIVVDRIPMAGLLKDELIFPQNIKLYLDNLLSLGLISIKSFVYHTHKKALNTHFADNKDQFPEMLRSVNLKESQRYEAVHEMYLISTFGTQFLETCLGESNDGDDS